jgi:aminoglycoside phosphotransferase (APT) family kinase protein
MSSDLEKLILNATGASQLHHIENIQTLWSGYGQIVRYGLTASKNSSVIVKHVKLPDINNHPRGWNTNRSHQRKIKSYQVESAWYQSAALLCDQTCRVPQSYAIETTDNEFFMLLEDLDAAGFAQRKQQVNYDDMYAVLTWLANFHATFINCPAAYSKLWRIGTYWHLDTRPDELQALDDIELKKAASAIDQALNHCHYQTLVHGDAKLANFCFSSEKHPLKEKQVAAVDFQYVGGGCGMKDVAYFIGSCLFEDDCERLEKNLLNDYFHELKQALIARKIRLDFNALEQEWRTMYPVAWTDFHRFIKGWSPGHWKVHSYSEQLSKEVIARLT